MTTPTTRSIARTPGSAVNGEMPVTSHRHGVIRRRRHPLGTPAPTRRRLPTRLRPSNRGWVHRPGRRRLSRRVIVRRHPRAVRRRSGARAISRTTCARSASPWAGVRSSRADSHRGRRRPSPVRSRRVRPGRGHALRSTGRPRTERHRRVPSSSTDSSLPDSSLQGSVRHGGRTRNLRGPIPRSRGSGPGVRLRRRPNRGPAGVVPRISIRSTRTGAHRSTDLPRRRTILVNTTTHRPDSDTDSPVRAVRRYTG